MNYIPRLLSLAVTAGLSANSLAAELSFPVVDTGQTSCYDNQKEIAPPQRGQPFYGQDAQMHHHPANYTLNSDGLTVHDNVTGLTWQRSSDIDGDGVLTRTDKLTFAQAGALPAKLNAAKFGGFDDWRLPSIKELYSLFDGRGTDPIGPMGVNTSRLKPFINTEYFKFAYGDVIGERVIDSQYVSNTRYVGQSLRGFGKVFGVNFADGESKVTTSKCQAAGRKRFMFYACAETQLTGGTIFTITAMAPSQIARPA